MIGQRPQSQRPPVRVSHALAFCGCVAMFLPIATALFAADKPSTTAPATAPASQPASAKTREQRRQEDIARVMEFFRVTQPDAYGQAKSLKDNDPEAFEKMIHSALNTVNKLEDLRKRNYPLYELCLKDFELAYKSLKLAKDIKRPDLPAGDRGLLTTQLTDLVSAQFDLRQQIRQMQIDDVQKQLADLDQQLQDRKADKDNLIKKRVDDLIETVPRLDW